jgi:hypothetical protein
MRSSPGSTGNCPLPKMALEMPIHRHCGTINDDFPDTTGVSNKEIAEALGCAEVTVENHLTALFRRSGARSRAGLVGCLLA